MFWAPPGLLQSNARVFSPCSSHPAVLWGNPAVPSSCTSLVKKGKDLLSRKQKRGRCETACPFSADCRGAVVVPRGILTIVQQPEAVKELLNGQRIA